MITSRRSGAVPLLPAPSFAARVDGSSGWCLDHRRRRDPLVRVLSRQWPDDQHDFGGLLSSAGESNDWTSGDGFATSCRRNWARWRRLLHSDAHRSVWCFDGMGTGSAGISHAAMRAALDAPVAVVDGGLNSDVLMLVHLGQHTTSVVVTTAGSRSIVLAHGGGFEVLRIPMAKCRIGTHMDLRERRLGRIIGFDNEGRVTSSLAFTWCPGSINTSPGPLLTTT